MRRAFQLQVDAGRSLIQHGDSGPPRLVKLGAVLFVAEDATIAQPLHNRGHRRRLVYLDFQFFPALVFAGVGQALVGQGNDPAGLTNPQQAGRFAQAKFRGIEHRVGFENAPLRHYETSRA